MKVALLGAGQFGQTSDPLLHGCRDYEDTVSGHSDSLQVLKEVGVAVHTRNTEDHGELEAALEGRGVVLNAVPYHLAIPTNSLKYNLTWSVDDLNRFGSAYQQARQVQSIS